MAAHTMSRVMAGSRMSMVSAQQSVKQVSNGAKYFMKRRNSYMVEVNVAETETEDQAVRRYMRAVVQSGVINKLRALRTKETKIETYKRKLAERAQARKLGIEEPTWEEFYGENVEEAKPFDEFFTKGNEDDEDLFLAPGYNGELPILDEGYYNGQMYDLNQFDNNANAMYNQGGYIDNNQGGYINQGAAAGGYMQPQQDGSYQQGGYINYTNPAGIDYSQQQPQQQQ